MTDEAGSTRIQRAVRILAEDVRPQSAEHWVRLAVAVGLVAAAIVNVLLHPPAKDWTRNDFVIPFGFILAACVVAFTKSLTVFILTIADIVPFIPYKKGGK